MAPSTGQKRHCMTWALETGRHTEAILSIIHTPAFVHVMNCGNVIMNKGQSLRVCVCVCVRTSQSRMRSCDFTDAVTSSRARDAGRETDPALSQEVTVNTCSATPPPLHKKPIGALGRIYGSHFQNAIKASACVTTPCAAPRSCVCVWINHRRSRPLNSLGAKVVVCLDAALVRPSLPL